MHTVAHHLPERGFADARQVDLGHAMAHELADLEPCQEHTIDHAPEMGIRRVSAKASISTHCNAVHALRQVKNSQAVLDGLQGW